MSKAIGLVGAVAAAGLLVFAAKTAERFTADDNNPNMVFVCVNGDTPISVRTPDGERSTSGLEQMFSTCDEHVASSRPVAGQPLNIAADEFNR